MKVYVLYRMNHDQNVFALLGVYDNLAKVHLAKEELLDEYLSEFFTDGILIKYVQLREEEYSLIIEEFEVQ